MRSNPLRWLAVFQLCAVFSLPALVAQPQDEGLSRHVFGSDIEIGGFWPALSTKVRLDALDGEVGTSVSFEDDLDYKSRETRPFIQGSWRISERWLVQLDYIQLNRANMTTLEREIEWPPGGGGEVFPVGVTVGSFLDFSSSRLAGAYIIKTSPDSELAFVGGLHWTSMGAGIELAADINGNLGAVSADVEFGPIPLPSVGVYWGTRIGENWMVRVRGDFFYLKYDDYSGGLVSLRTDGSYQFSTHWSVGAGLNYYRLAGRVERRNSEATISFGYWGPNAFLRYSF